MKSAYNITSSTYKLSDHLISTFGVYTRVFRVCLAVFSLLLGTYSSNACTIVCRNSLNISLDLSGQAVITPSLLLQDPTCNPSDFTVNILDGSGNSYGNTLTCALAGQTVMARVTHTATGNYCTTDILVQDYLAPFIDCRDTVIPCTFSTDPMLIGYPNITDNCTAFSSLQITYTDQVTELACYTLINGDSVTTLTERTWQVADDSGNSSSCVQRIYHKRSQVEEVSFPTHMDGFVRPALSCLDDPTDLDVTGRPTIAGQEILLGGRCELVVTHTDQIADICSPGSYRILRNWNVIDWCSGKFQIGIQVIKVEDVNAPVLNMPADVTVGTNVDNCNAHVLLPQATASDDCSGVTISASWAFGTGFGPFFNIPQGNHTVIYTATDDCGNQSSDSLLVHIEDRTVPVAVCDHSIQLGLSSGGRTEIPATTFDDGSHDNCSAVSLQVRRAGSAYGPFVAFDCDDLLVDSIEVWLQVTDAAGNTNECSSFVFLEDAIRPTMICPTDRNLDCTQDVTDLGITGQPSVSDNCGIDSLYYVDQPNLNECGVGNITRTWHVLDLRGNHSVCIQQIVLEDRTPFSIIFPSDTSLLSCTTGYEPALTGRPQFINEDCEQLYVAHEDAIFDYGFPACYKIIRTWEVIEWCTYDPNSGSDDGRWVHEQVISVYDTEAPVITCHQQDTLVETYAADCGSSYISLRPTTAQDCNPDLSITNDSPYADAGGADASGTYPVGIHLITFRAVDGCGNESSCSFQVVVRDAKPPSPLCLPALRMNLPAGGILVPDAKLFDLGSSDNCTEAADLVFQLEPESFDCNNIGEQIVYLIVTDEYGNSSSCTSVLTIADDNGVCPFANIGGSIENEKGLPIQGVEVQLSGGLDSVVAVAPDGTFLIEKLPTGTAYTLEPQKDTDYKNGISTYDLVQISQHALGIRLLSSPYKIIAGDVDNSGFISAFDLVEVRKLVLDLEDGFQKNNSWRFVRADYNFPRPTNPFRYAFPEVYEIEQLDEDILDANFIAIKIGDVNTNHNPSRIKGEGSERSAAGGATLEVDEQVLAAPDRIRVPVRWKDLPNLLGFQFALAFDTAALHFENIEFTEYADAIGLGASNVGLSKNGSIAFSWHQAKNTSIPSESILFELIFDVEQAGRLSDYLWLAEERLLAEAYDPDLEIRHLALNFNMEDPDSDIFQVSQNYPNPFREHCQVDFYISQPSKVRFQLVDQQGRLLHEVSQHYERGQHAIQLDRSALNLSPGTYYYWLETENGSSKSFKILAL